MAIWQYSFHVLPKQSFENSINYRLINNENGFDDSPFWAGQKVRPVFFEVLSKILPKAKSWSKNIDLYGNQESNCFEVLILNETVDSVSFRIDFTSNYEGVLIELLEFFIHNGLIVLDENLNVIPLNFESIRGVIENSPQIKKYKKLSGL